ncbi:hypothetical protein O7614_22690 [Micromonospora sp. WMMD961]|uniref:hypothetical protein n=1 Tax=Micromonospora sp. WMMD961 TaxID=3016100 RepID=UPI002417C74D|nr:hypothetical protein [Micromonospora sp. WMMD961]MDG4782473.1 hypothetical protein [Micromonospora sp. WMMD961]
MLVVFRAMLWRLPIGAVVLSLAASAVRGPSPLAIAAAMTVGMLTIAFSADYGEPVYARIWPRFAALR